MIDIIGKKVEGDDRWDLLDSEGSFSNGIFEIEGVQYKFLAKQHVAEQRWGDYFWYIFTDADEVSNRYYGWEAFIGGTENQENEYDPADKGVFEVTRREIKKFVYSEKKD